MTVAPDSLQFKTTDDERELLKHVVHHAGWKIAMEIMDGYVDALIDGAQMASLADPLGNRDRIALSWAYVHIAQRLQAKLQEGVKFELEVLQLHRQEKLLDPAEEAQLRRDKFTLEAI